MGSKTKRVRKQRGPAPTLSRAEQKAATHARVLRAAMDVFSQYGFAAASTALIAKRAGVSHGTVFVVAPTKERLAVAAFEESIRAVATNGFLTMPAKGTLSRRLEHVFTRLFDYYALNPALSSALLQYLTFAADPVAQKEYQHLIVEFLSAIEQPFIELSLRGKLHADISTREAAHLVFSVYLFSLLLLLKGSYPDRASHAAAFRRLLEAALRGVGG